MQRMRALLNFDENVATFRSGDKISRISLVTEGAVESNYIRDKFTTDDKESTDKSSNSDEEEDGELVLVLQKVYK